MVKEKIITSPSKILYTQLGVPKNYKDKLIEETYKLKKRRGRENDEIFKRIFNEKGNKVIGSGFELWQESNIYNTLLKNILKFITINSPIDWNYKIVNTWAGIYEKGQVAIRHSHEPLYKSFCYYISAKEPQTPMVFDDVDITINAITDRLIIFPSDIFHSVPPCNGGERIMIAGNVLPIYKSKGFNGY